MINAIQIKKKQQFCYYFLPLYIYSLQKLATAALYNASMLLMLLVSTIIIVITHNSTSGSYMRQSSERWLFVSIKNATNPQVACSTFGPDSFRLCVKGVLFFYVKSDCINYTIHFNLSAQGFWCLSERQRIVIVMHWGSAKADNFGC